eukprot:COSAG02_NODE_18466_length_936_cov_1.913978_1_plen_72_part_10
MQFHTGFQYDPAQDRRAGRTGQQRLELEVCAFACLRETFFPAYPIYDRCQWQCARHSPYMIGANGSVRGKKE